MRRAQGQLEELERELLETNGNAERLARSYNELVELQLVLERAGAFFDETRGRASAAAFETTPAAPDGAPLALGARPDGHSLCDGFDTQLHATLLFQFQPAQCAVSRTSLLVLSARRVQWCCCMVCWRGAEQACVKHMHPCN